MEEAAALERDCADAWPAITDEALGQWRLRAAGGFTGRANSVLTVGDPGIPVPAALVRAVAFAHANGIPPKAHVITDSPVERHVAAAGWRVDDDHPGGADVLVMTGPLPTGPTPSGVTVPEHPASTWWPLAVGAPEPTAAQRHVLAGRPGVGFGIAIDDGRTVGVVRGVVVGDLLHIARLAVAPSHRRTGLATGLLSALTDWARPKGARRCVLQVAAHNVAAVSLYAKLGCRTHHRYRYWIPA